MKRLFATFIVSCLIMISGGTLFAKPISQEQAKEIAIRWMGRMRIADTFVSAEKILKAKGVKVGYLITFSPKGYVVIPIDDSFALIKAWGEGFFKGPLREMVIESLSKQEEMIFEKYQKEEREERGRFTATGISDIIVRPLLQTEWGQNYPYNDRCPIDINSGDKSATGCVATAMAQIMRYWKWPNIGCSSKCYYQPKNENEFCADFEHFYDWDAMPSKLYADSNPWAIFQVSQLIYDIGVIANTEYSSSSSGGYHYPLFKGIKKYMKYDCNSTYVDEEELFSVVKPDIDNDWPVFIGGKHAFVADGYLEFFGIKQLHFNFGWNGASNGWYTPNGLKNFNFLSDRVDYYVMKEIHPICSANYPEFCANSSDCFQAGCVWHNNQCEVKCQPDGMVASRFPLELIELKANKIIISARRVLFQPELIIPKEDWGKKAQPIMYIHLHGYGYTILWGDRYITLSNMFRYIFFPKPIDFAILSGKTVDIYLGYMLSDNSVKYACYQIKFVN
ncbi:MAG: hypothetical protein GWO87_01730 [Xanthomonadaceae bacterium]|nr:hypothetical protein [Rhodospirillaceae bacterium]NIA17891.1 hypothetical protein [Xanthomonadaceae bacterium]